MKVNSHSIIGLKRIGQEPSLTLRVGMELLYFEKLARNKFQFFNALLESEPKWKKNPVNKNLSIKCIRQMITQVDITQRKNKNKQSNKIK